MKLNHQLKCLIFDLDGTLADNSQANYLSYREAYKHFRINLSKTKYQKTIGLRFSEQVELIAPQLSASQKQALHALKQRRYRKHLDLIKPNLALIDFIRFAHPNFDICLATAASRTNTMAILQHLKIRSFFKVIICGEDVSLPKPDPECYLQCFEKLNLKPTQCLIFEDSPPGLAAAAASGAPYLQILSDINPPIST